MTLDGIELTAATAADRDFIYQTKKDGMEPYVVATWGQWDEPESRRRFEDSFDRGAHRIILADGEPVGFIEWYEQVDAVRLSNIALVASARNRGTGAVVIDQLCRRVQRPVRLRVLKVNPALRFYERLGFRIVGDPEVHWWEMLRDPAHGVQSKPMP